MADHPEEFELVDQYLEAARNSHLHAFRVDRRLVELDADGEHTRKLLSESAAIVLQDMPALTRDWRALVNEWFEVELLDPANVGRKTRTLKARYAELRPALDALLVRQVEMAAELADLLDRAQRP